MKELLKQWQSNGDKAQRQFTADDTIALTEKGGETPRWENRPPV